MRKRFVFEGDEAIVFVSSELIIAGFCPSSDDCNEAPSGVRASGSK